jgi:hypothetical protein
VAAVAPSKSLRVTVPETELGAQVISNTSPTFTTWPLVGTEIASKPAVWAKTEEMEAKMAAETNE